MTNGGRRVQVQGGPAPPSPLPPPPLPGSEQCSFRAQSSWSPAQRGGCCGLSSLALGVLCETSKSLGGKRRGGGEEGSRCLGSPLPQLASSLLSWQSLSPSQMKAGLVQIPVEHWNCPGRHLNSAARKGASESEGLGLGMATGSLGGRLAPTKDLLATPALGTYDSPGARLSGPHNHPPCHTSTRRGCTCRSCTQTGGQVGARGVGGDLGNLGGFCLRGWDVSKKWESQDIWWGA